MHFLRVLVSTGPTGLWDPEYIKPEQDQIWIACPYTSDKRRDHLLMEWNRLLYSFHSTSDIQILPAASCHIFFCFSYFLFLLLTDIGCQIPSHCISYTLHSGCTSVYFEVSWFSDLCIFWGVWQWKALVLIAYSLMSRNSLCSEMKRQSIITTMGERSERIYSLILVH